MLLYCQASELPVLYLFILLINAALNYFLKRNALG